MIIFTSRRVVKLRLCTEHKQTSAVVANIIDRHCCWVVNIGFRHIDPFIAHSFRTSNPYQFPVKSSAKHSQIFQPTNNFCNFIFRRPGEVTGEVTGEVVDQIFKLPYLENKIIMGRQLKFPEKLSTKYYYTDICIMLFWVYTRNVPGHVL